MSGEGVRGDGGYEHGGGYQPGATFSPREIAVGVLVGLLAGLFAMVLDRFAPFGPSRDLFHLLIGVAMLAFAGWEIYRAGWQKFEDELPDPPSLLYPERVYDDARGARRRRLIAGAIILVGAIAVLAHAASRLLETGVPFANLPAVIFIATFVLVAHLAAGEYHRRRRQSSPE